MSKRKDLESLGERWGPFSFRMMSVAWELGRIAGIREAASQLDVRPATIYSSARSLRAHARKLKRRLK